MTLEQGSMANGGGFVAVREEGRSYLRCPAHGCRWGLELTDLGQFVDLGVSEDSLRAHLASHDPADWLRTIASLQATTKRLADDLDRERTMREVVLTREAAAQWREAKAKADRDRAWLATALLMVRHPGLVRRCCAVQALAEVADTLQRSWGDTSPDDAHTVAKAREHLAAAEADHDEHA